MAGADVGSLKATLEFDLGDAKSVLDDFKGSLDEIVDKLNERFSFDIDASGASSALDDAKQKADEFQDTADKLKGTEISADSSGFTSAVDSAGSSTDALAGQLAGLKSTIDTAFDIAIVAAFAAAIWEAGDAVMGLAEQFATMQDASQRAAMFGNTAMADMQARTAQIMEQADIAAVKFGVPSEQVAGMIGTFAQFGTTQFSQDLINAAVGAARGMQLEPSDLARGIQSAYTTTQGAYSQQDLLDMFSRAYMTTGLAPTTQTSTALTKLQPMAGELGGMPGELATLMYGTQIMPGGRGMSMIASGLASFDKQLNETYLTVDSKGKAVIKGSEDIYNAFQQAGLSLPQEQARGSLQALNDLYEAGQRMGKDFFTQAFGSQAGVMEALGAGLPKIQAFKSILEDSGGSTEDLAAKVDDLQMSLDRMDEAFGNMGEAAGSLAEGPLRNLADFVAGPLLDGFNKIIDKLKSGDIKGAVKEAFDLGDIILKAPIGALEQFRNEILSFDWRDLGHTVAGILGDSMSQINIDASELGKTVAAGLAAAIDFARGAFSWDALFGKTPLDAFLKPIEKVMSAEFGLIAAEMTLKMKEGSVGAVQAIYTFHDEAVMALAGVLASVQVLAESFAEDLYNAIKSAYDWFTSPWNLVVDISTGGGGGGTAGATGGVAGARGETGPSGTYYWPVDAAGNRIGSDIYYDQELQYRIQSSSLTSSSTNVNMSKALSEMGYSGYPLPPQIAGFGGAQAIGTGVHATSLYDWWTAANQQLYPPEPAAGASSYMTGGNVSGTPQAADITGTVSGAIQFLDTLQNKGSEFFDKWGEENWPKIGTGVGIQQPTNVAGLSEVQENTGSGAKSSSQTAQNTEQLLSKWDRYNLRNIDMLGGFLGKYEPDLTKERENVSIAQQLLNAARKGLEGLETDANQTGDSVEKLGESSKTAAQANQESTQTTLAALGYLKALTATEELGPEAFRAAVEDLGTMYQGSFVGPTALYAAEFPERQPARLGAISPYNMSDAEYQTYYNQVLGGAALSGRGYTSSAMMYPQGGPEGGWLATSESLQPEKVTYLNAEVVADTSQADQSISNVKQSTKEPLTFKVATDTAEFEQSWKDMTTHTGKFAPDPKTGDMFKFDYGIKPESTPVLESAIASVQKQASEGQVMDISADTGSAKRDITDLGDMAGKEKRMPITLGGYESARAKIDDLTQDEYKYIYIITIKSTVGGGGGGGTEGWNLGMGSTWGKSLGEYFSVPTFQHEGFVPRPTLAVVGDRPGGEYVLSAERVQRMAGGGGGAGGSITLNAPLIVNAPVYGVSDLEQLFDEHTREIQQLVAQTQSR